MTPPPRISAHYQSDPDGPTEDTVAIARISARVDALEGWVKDLSTKQDKMFNAVMAAAFGSLGTLLIMGLELVLKKLGG